MSEQDKILVSEVPTANGKLGRLVLNVVSTLNSLTLEMSDVIQQQLDTWKKDDAIKLIWIEGAGEKAFCAGGDVQALYRSATEKPGGPCEYAEAFFKSEYKMNYTLHTYNKPIVCWGHGIVMGGGLGILAGCSHRILTEKSRIGMPEVTIALFPDVGGSWFLNRMPGKSGLFIALTASNINAADAVFTGIADHIIESSEKDKLFNLLVSASYSGDINENHAIVAKLIGQCNAVNNLESNIETHLDYINMVCCGRDINHIISSILAIHTDDKWLGKARAGLASGSPLAAKWIYRQLFNTRHASLREVFLSELLLATNIVRHPEFAEGVRALLIDKDRNPSWQVTDYKAVTDDLTNAFFVAPWQSNPLAELIQD